MMQSGGVPPVKPAQWVKFFKAISEAKSISAACRIAGMSRTSFYRYVENDVSIKHRYDEAQQAGREFLEDAALKRAVHGVRKEIPYLYEGTVVHTVVETRYSDQLLITMLKARVPAYRDDQSTAIQRGVQDELERMMLMLKQRISAQAFNEVIDALVEDQKLLPGATTYEDPTIST